MKHARIEIYVSTKDEKEEINRVAREQGFRGPSAYLIDLHKDNVKKRGKK
jgi:hypothetical protein